MDLGFKDVHVLITGASGGIGLATCKLFLDLGAQVTGHYNTTRAPLDSTFSETVHAVQADLKSEGDVTRMFDDLKSPVSVLVVNHGIWETRDAPLVDMDLSQWEHTLDTNLTSSFLIVRAFLRQLRDAPEEVKTSANIVFIGSTAGRFGEAGHADYAASKSALMYGLTLSLKNEIVRIAPRGRVNTIAPGWVRTPMAEEALKDAAVVYRSLATTPLKRFATAGQVATQIALIASNNVSGHVTGEVITVAGGMEGRLLNQPTDVDVNAV
ncbi:NAD dependent epimerase/dehydratase [Exidia glandulosa HHB12029]|uniref:NAD dependent epimerase/dehydratase n=1 Tax=Exidia glandulosa HHB12029 TaxID=1314781 RepID=A0A165BDI3_EXIGL|nr:NAD dependent epimerase/dehydratase [Exidia glandulosa HHB12029]